MSTPQLLAYVVKPESYLTRFRQANTASCKRFEQMIEATQNLETKAFLIAFCERTNTRNQACIKRLDTLCQSTRATLQIRSPGGL